MGWWQRESEREGRYTMSYYDHDIIIRYTNTTQKILWTPVIL